MVPSGVDLGLGVYSQELVGAGMESYEIIQRTHAGLLRVRGTVELTPVLERDDYELPAPGGPGPGDWLVCLRAERNAYRFGFCLVPGQLYRAERNRLGLDYERCVTIGGEAFSRHRFRQATAAEIEYASRARIAGERVRL